jgi:phosphoribosylglycinamide formyltransferase-1
VISQPLKLGFLASGNGSSARAIVGAIRSGALAAEPRVLVSNIRTAPALAFAAEAAIPAFCVPTRADPEGADRRLAAVLVEHAVELVVLSGYLRHLGPRVLERYRGRVLNIHPGPLPRFGGEGMYGRRVHEAVVAARLDHSEISIHVVDDVYDHGPVVARRAVPIAAQDTAQDLEARITALEPAFFLGTLQRLASGELQLPD